MAARSGNRSRRRRAPATIGFSAPAGADSPEMGNATGSASNSVGDEEPVVTDGEAVSAALETSFVDENADVPDLTDSGGESSDRQTDATSTP